MSRLEELIRELCPEGVEYKNMGDMCQIRTGKLNANAKDDDGKYPFFTCDANPYRINEYAFDTSAILISGNGSQVGHINSYEGKFNAYQRTYVLDEFKHVEKAFLFHYMRAYLKEYITFIKKNKEHEVYNKHVVIIFDECHRSQFGDMHAAIVKSFKKYHLFGFTGTPIFPANTGSIRKPQFFTTEQTFGDQLHTYTIVDAINDKNVLPFRVDYIKTMDMDEDIDDEQVWDIAREKAMMAPERIRLVTEYILNNFDRKTYRGDKTYIYNTLTNISQVASGKNGAVEEIKQKQRISGFNSIFAVASVPMAKLYYQEFKKQMAADPTKKLRVSSINFQHIIYFRY